MAGEMTKRELRVLDTVVYPNGDTRDRSFGFSKPQKPRVAKIRHPRPEKKP